MMQSSPIKSRPVYGRLKPVTEASLHIIAAQGEGAQAVVEAFSDQGILARSLILFAACPATNGSGHIHALHALSAKAVDVVPCVNDLLVRLPILLEGVTMGTRLYVAGTEGFIGQVCSQALHHAVDADAIQTERRGPLTRRVQCVHCKSFTDDVIASPAQCAHCGLQMLVRDHYSRRLGAFMGVCIDAEAPGVVPVAEAFRS